MAGILYRTKCSRHFVRRLMTTQTYSKRFSVPVTRIWISSAIAIGGVYAAWQLLGGATKSEIGVVLGAFISVSVTLLGFLLAALSILSALVNRRLVMNMQKTGHYQQLTKEMFVTAAAYLVAMVLSLLALFLDGDALRYACAITSGAVLFATLEMISSGLKFYRVMILLN